MKSIEDEMDKNTGEGASNTVEERSDRILTPVQHCVYERITLESTIRIILHHMNQFLFSIAVQSTNTLTLTFMMKGDCYHHGCFNLPPKHQ